MKQRPILRHFLATHAYRGTNVLQKMPAEAATLRPHPAFRAFFSNPLLDDWQVQSTIANGKVASLRAQEAPWSPLWHDDRDDLGVFDRR